MFKLSTLALALLATSQLAYAQQQVPGAGTQLQQIPLPPPAQTTDLDLEIERPAAPVDTTPGTAIPVSALRLSGQTIFADSELTAATGFVPGNEITLGQLRGYAAQIASYYHARGYFLAQAYLPQQAIENGVVTIAVVEGRYGEIDLRNEAGIAPGVPGGILSGLSSGDLVFNPPLERRLLLLSDIPGVRTKATLSPGAEVGTSDLIVDLTRGPLISGYVEADNAGSRYTGRYRAGGAININNPAGIGDQLSLRLLASDDGLAYGRAAYSLPASDGRIGVSYAHLRYTLGAEFEALDGSGTADIISAFGSYPLVRSRRANLNALAAFDYKFLRDEFGAVDSVSRKHVPALTLGLAGDSRDDFGGGGSNVFSVGWTSGQLDIRDPGERAIDAVTARSDGSFNKLQAGLARLQSVSDIFSIYAGVRGQLAFDNLDSSEKIQLGGAYGVRAYPEGEAFGDTGYVATAEARLGLDPLLGDTLPGQFELSTFVDTGAVRFAQDPWFTGDNHARRSGYGAGLTWLAPEGLFLKASYARRLGDVPVTSGPDQSGQFWFQIVKQF